MIWYLGAACIMLSLGFVFSWILPLYKLRPWIYAIIEYGSWILGLGYLLIRPNRIFERNIDFVCSCFAIFILAIGGSMTNKRKRK